ncbi:hypothetical protein [Legionella jordanis]|uniref:DUF86 domain-containing protein n=1 Tax=Legionella jordanis TaxID=456 RepID=A0A0W0VD37_9GAMM|nr:hypothetical protein [Legionella jordanis]KTD17789.1 hypothetical protein Ljor_2095 [Legionella jordanis]RMX02507.1 hypothetical protein EAW55_09690 [Legionella jordanis]RMX21645.1 hypothetical protein EAS68_02500 [Legionella jordanis]VEH11275.1 Uncharacterised protein [Legionella jordanis]HAT8713758.1 hypothetical protein [Legionella jordanis]
MDKKSLSPLELIKIATEHAYCAQHLLQQNAEVAGSGHEMVDALMPIASLMYTAFELTLKACLLQDHKKIGPPKRLMELVDLNSELDMSAQDKQLIKSLAKQQAFRKGLDYELWDDRQQLHVFCSQILDVYERLQHLIPIELQKIYQ